MPDLDRLASDVADRVICHVCEGEAKLAIADSLFEALGYHVVHLKRRRPRINWAGRDRILRPFERRMGAMLKGVWDEERRIVLANMKRMGPKAHRGRKDSSLVDFWLYPVEPQKKKLAKGTKGVLSGLISDTIERTIAAYELESVSFDLVNERALGWLNEYVVQLSGNLEEVNVHDLKTALTEGLDLGESMDKLRDRVNEIFTEYDRKRAEVIARTETIRTQEEGNLAVYKEAGFERKIWIANPECCPICEELDGVDVPIDDPYPYDDGGYSDRMGPPAHPYCRCASAPFMSEWAD